MSAAHPHPGTAPRPLDVRDALALEAYADRLERHRRRLADDLDAARLRTRWHEHERAARRQLTPEHLRALTDAGVLAPNANDLDERRTIERRRSQLAAIAELQSLTHAALDRLPPPENCSPEQTGWLA